jgi:hypothetical protein
MLIWRKTTWFTHVSLYTIPIKCSKAEITVVKWKKGWNYNYDLQNTTQKTKDRTTQCNFCNYFQWHIFFNIIWLDYIFKEVQIYIKLLLISSKAETNYIITYVLISTERVKNEIYKVGILNLRKKRSGDFTM